MNLIAIRKRSLTIETVYHEGGPPVDTPLRIASACAVIRNPYAGRYEPDLLPFMAELRTLGTMLAEELVATLGKEKVQAYSKAAIVGVNGELEHGAVWHEAGAGQCDKCWVNPKPSCRRRRPWPLRATA